MPAARERITFPGQVPIRFRRNRTVDTAAFTRSLETTPSEQDIRVAIEKKFAPIPEFAQSGFDINPIAIPDRLPRKEDFDEPTADELHQAGEMLTLTMSLSMSDRALLRLRLDDDTEEVQDVPHEPTATEIAEYAAERKAEARSQKPRIKRQRFTYTYDPEHEHLRFIERIARYPNEYTEVDYLLADARNQIVVRRAIERDGHGNLREINVHYRRPMFAQRYQLLPSDRNEGSLTIDFERNHDFSGFYASAEKIVEISFGRHTNIHIPHIDYIDVERVARRTRDDEFYEGYRPKEELGISLNKPGADGEKPEIVVQYPGVFDSGRYDTHTTLTSGVPFQTPNTEEVTLSYRKTLIHPVVVTVTHSEGKIESVVDYNDKKYRHEEWVIECPDFVDIQAVGELMVGDMSTWPTLLQRYPAKLAVRSGPSLGRQVKGLTFREIAGDS